MIPGFYAAREGELLYLLITHENNDGSTSVTTLNMPTTTEIEAALKEYNLPVEYTMHIIKDRDPKTYSVLINVNEYWKHLQEVGFRV